LTLRGFFIDLILFNLIKIRHMNKNLSLWVMLTDTPGTLVKDAKKGKYYRKR